MIFVFVRFDLATNPPRLHRRQRGSHKPIRHLREDPDELVPGHMLSVHKVDGVRVTTGDGTQHANCRISQIYGIPGPDHRDGSDRNNQAVFRKCDRTFPSTIARRRQTHMVPQREHSGNLLHSETTKRLPVCHQSQFVSLGYTVSTEFSGP